MVNDPELIEVAGEVNALTLALETHGHLIEGTDLSHLLVTSRYHLYTLRRTPPNDVCPYADGPPVLRIFYAWFLASAGDEYAVIFRMGDKAQAPSQYHWYPPIIGEIENRMIPAWESLHPGHKAKVRKTR